MDFNSPIISGMVHFAIGGASGALATCIIQPLDTLKVQVQIISERIGRTNSSAITVPTIFMKIRQEKGLKVLYRGLDSAIFRQIFYASTRLGLYDLSMQKLQKIKNRKANMMQRSILSFISGACGAIVGNPFDVALIRRQASIQSGKMIYRNTYHAFKTICVTQGLFSLWTGINITIMRVALINFGQLAGRDIISQYFDKYNIANKYHNNVVALTASLFTAFISLPADNIKVKLQKQQNNHKIYNGIIDCFRKTVVRQGPCRLWVGFPIYVIRGTPHSFILIRTQMFLNDKWKKIQEKF